MVERIEEQGAPATSHGQQLHAHLQTIEQYLQRSQLAEYVQLINTPRQLIWRNLLAGIARGVGIAIGFTLFSATIVYGLKQIGALNLPIIGQYIAELVEIVQRQMKL